MLSPGKYHELVPKDLEENIKYRLWLHNLCKADPKFRRTVREWCRQDILFYINSFCLQFNPEHFGNEEGPFITWPFQDISIIGGEVDGEHEWGILECIEDREDARWPKSREMGASWIVLMVIDWLGRFSRRKKMLVVSRDADAVDRPDDPDCLFWKLDFIHQHLPKWLAGTVKRRKMGITYLDTSSTINGEANTISAGVGGRAALALFDEFGQFKDGEEIYSRTADVSHCRLFVFTHKNSQSMAYDLCYDAQYSGMREIKTHWTQHPEKNKGLYRYDEQHNKVEVLDKTYKFPDDFVFNMECKPTGGPYPGLRSPWYDKECRRRPARAVAMDLDIDPQGASEQFFEVQLIKILKGMCQEPLWKGDILFDRETAKPLGLAENHGGLVHLWINPKSLTEVPVMRCGGGADLSWGTGATPSCLSFINGTTGEKVLEYVNANMGPHDFAYVCVALCRLFKDEDGEGARLCWEIQGPGIVFGRKVVELGYRNIYYREDEDALGKMRTNNLTPGWNPTAKAAMGLLSPYQDALKYRKLVNRSWYALDECNNFVYTADGVEYKKRGSKKKDADALEARVHHGDIVIADALAWKMCKGMALTAIEKQEEGAKPGSLAWRRLYRERQLARESDWTRPCMAR